MAEHSATVTEIKQLAPAVVQLTVVFPEGYFEFEPGQWVNRPPCIRGIGKRF